MRASVSLFLVPTLFLVTHVRADLILVIDPVNDEMSWSGDGFTATGLDVGVLTPVSTFLSTDVTTNPNPSPLGGSPEGMGLSESLETTVTDGTMSLNVLPGNEGTISITPPSGGGLAPLGRLSVFLDTYFNFDGADSLIDISVAVPSAGPFSYSLTPAAENYLTTLDGASLTLNSQSGGSVANVATISVIPEPATGLLLLPGAILLLGRRRRR